MIKLNAGVMCDVAFTGIHLIKEISESNKRAFNQPCGLCGNASMLLSYTYIAHRGGGSILCEQCLNGSTLSVAMDKDYTAKEDTA